MAERVDPNVKFRAILAISIVLVGIVGMFVLSGFAVGLADDTGRAEMMRLVFVSILPLLGTWVGTVLAFYFARESLQAATDSTARLMGRLDPQAPVSQVMIPRGRITAKTVASETDGKAVPLPELMTLMKAKGVHRIPVLDASAAVLWVVHDSTINAYAAAAPNAPTPPTVAELLSRPEYAAMVEAIGVVSPVATVAEARSVMGSLEGCNDVFVTSGGKRTEPVEGWLTNTDLAGWR